MDDERTLDIVHETSWLCTSVLFGSDNFFGQPTALDSIDVLGECAMPRCDHMVPNISLTDSNPSAPVDLFPDEMVKT